MKWIPIYGMFTKDINELSEYSDLNYPLAVYHALWTFAVIFSATALILK